MGTLPCPRASHRPAEGRIALILLCQRHVLIHHPIRILGQAKNIAFIQVYASTSAATGEETLLKIIMKKIETKLKEEISNIQAGFRKNGGIQDPLFIVRIIQTDKEVNASLCACFIKYNKRTFDRVNHQMVWQSYQTHLIDLITLQMSAISCTTRMQFPVTRGVKLRCIYFHLTFSTPTQKE